MDEQGTQAGRQGHGMPDGAGLAASAAPTSGAGLASGAGPRPVKDAATVLLVRAAQDGGPGGSEAAGAAAADGRGVEVFMQVRASTMAFASGAAVFPGGSVDPSDYEGSEAWGTDSDANAAVLRHDPQDADAAKRAGAVVSAALRESYEECGVLLATPPLAAAATATPTTARPWVEAQDREDLSAHRSSLSAVLARRGLVPDLGALREVDRWVTPEGEPRRYDTHFFVAALPQGQEADGETTESAQSFWIAPAEALRRFAAGDLFLMPPTWAQLERLSQAGGVEQALRLSATGITQPILDRSDGRVVARFWGSEAYGRAARQAEAALAERGGA